MHTSLNRWAVPLSWLVAMLIVWSLFVPDRVTVTTFFLLGGAGLIVAIFAGRLLENRTPPQSVGAIIADLEAPGRSGLSPRQPDDGRNPGRR